MTTEHIEKSLIALAERIDQAGGGPLYIDHTAATAIREIVRARQAPAPVGAPRLPADVIQAISRYGDARADDIENGTTPDATANALGDAIKSIRQWAATLATPRSTSTEAVGLEMLTEDEEYEITRAWTDCNMRTLIRNGIRAFATKNGLIMK